MEMTKPIIVRRIIDFQLYYTYLKKPSAFLSQNRLAALCIQIPNLQLLRIWTNGITIVIVFQ